MHVSVTCICRWFTTYLWIAVNWRTKQEPTLRVPIYLKQELFRTITSYNRRGRARGTSSRRAHRLPPSSPGAGERVVAEADAREPGRATSRSRLSGPSSPARAGERRRRQSIVLRYILNRLSEWCKLYGVGKLWTRRNFFVYNVFANS